jgi:uncharacterized repeat protein (TIGR01451 family)
VVPAPVVTPEAAGLVAIDPGMNVEFRKSLAGLPNTIAAADNLFTLPVNASNLLAQGFDNGVKFIHYNDNGGTEEFVPPQRDVGQENFNMTFQTGPPNPSGDGGASPPSGTFNPNVQDDNFAMLATGYIYIPTTGTWDFEVASDDGFDLQIGGQDVNQYNGGRGYGFPPNNNSNFGPNTIVNAPGLYKFQLVWFQGGGGASCDFYAIPPGSSTPELVGDTADGGLAAFQGEASLVKTAPATATSGTPLTYSLSLLTQIPSGFSNGLVSENVTLSVNVADMLPANTTFQSVSAPAGWSVMAPAVGTAGTVTASNAALTPGTANFSLVVNVGGVVTGTVISNTGTFSDSSGDTGSSNTVSTTVSAVADVAIQMSAPSGAASQSTVTYTITVTNNGPSPAANVSLTDSLPANTTFVSQSQTSGPAFTLTNSASGISDTIASLAAGSKATPSTSRPRTREPPSAIQPPSAVQRLTPTRPTTARPSRRRSLRSSSWPLARMPGPLPSSTSMTAPPGR